MFSAVVKVFRGMSASGRDAWFEVLPLFLIQQVGNGLSNGVHITHTGDLD